MQHTYSIDGQNFSVDLESEENFFVGKNEVLSERFADLTKNQSWHPEGYTVKDTQDIFDISIVEDKIRDKVKSIIKEINPKIKFEKEFSLETYHQYVNDDDHLKVINRTRSLFPTDLDIDSDKIVAKLSSYMGSSLSYNNSVSDFISKPIVVRLNRPNSIGFNPAHKDIYQAFDESGYVPKMINVWIPVCGVNKLSGLPVAPGSHLIPEIKIERAKAGSLLNGQKYNVNSILRWDNKSDLKTISPENNEMIIFSSHLIHGLAINQNTHTTRVSLEFRLYEKS
jgi:ectoine hydroxylase-related dioxygenase (phytanoyl-CoA dioxygenase family)